MASWDSMITECVKWVNRRSKGSSNIFCICRISYIDTGVDALGGIMGLVDTFLNGGRNRTASISSLFVMAVEDRSVLN